MIKDPIILNKVQDEVFANKSYWPTEDGTTFCNVATQDVLKRLGYGSLEGFTADGMYDFIKTSDDWLIKPMADSIELVKEGVILVAILPASKLGQDHGHCNTLTPGSPDVSGKWGVKTPLCMNLGRVGTCFRAKGENWAFQIQPEIFALKETL